MIVGNHSNDAGLSDTQHSRANDPKYQRALLIGCIGVVYGDIGTSPLYAFREAAHQASQGGLHPIEIFGILSLIIWSLIVIVTLKYVLLLLRADNKGEGGVLSLFTLVQKNAGRAGPLVFFGALTGAALFYGDAMITPAISVLSAVEGIKIVTPALEHYILPLAMTILILLFSLQRTGTGKVASFFGPITILWFLTLALVGTIWIVRNPEVLISFNPYYAAMFLITHSEMSLIILGAIFLAVTGVEALYVDLGHFGRKPIQRAWLYLVFPALTLNYLGQGALLLSLPEATEHPFFLMVPQWALMPMVGLATLATIIASQATITGAFSLTRQAIQLGFLPRMEIRHTSADNAGQIYMPKINSYLMFGVILLCVLFRSSSALASAYGIAVNGTMIVTTIMAFFAIRIVWKKSWLVCLLLTVPFLCIEGVFLTSNMMKVADGGYIPLGFAAFCVLLMSVWVYGTAYLYRKSQKESVSTADLVETLDRKPLHMVEGTAIFLTSDPLVAPDALLQNLKHNRILHETNVILTVQIAHVPKIAESQRLVIEPLSSHMTRIIINFGYMETPDVPKALYQASWYGFDIDVENATFFLNRRKIVPDHHTGLPRWLDNMYVAMTRTAVAATDFYRIPLGRVVEMGTQMAI